MAQGRSLLGEICKNFINSLKPRKYWGELRGKDSFGTEYYEATDTPRGKRAKRWFVPHDGKNFDIDRPPEWEIWLRHGRKQPPTEEEIQANYMKRMTAVENAKKLEKPKTVHKDDIKTFDKPAFPVYEEYSLGIEEKTEKKKTDLNKK